MFGIPLDGWQEVVLEAAMGERSDATWAAKRVGLSVPRQNGKSQLMVARALAGALLFGEKKIVVSAHQQDTAREAFAKLMEIIEADGNASLRSRLDKRFGRDGVMNALNREAVRFTTGATIQFKARSGAGGKGFSSDCLLLDEAQILGSRAWTSINSTMSAMPNPQVWLIGTPPQEEDDCFAFDAVRRSALEGRSTNAAFVEWSADPKAKDYDPASEYTRWTANPAWNIRINHEVVQGEFETYTPEKFAQDRLGVWSEESDGTGVIDADKWRSHLGDLSPDMTSVVLAVDTTLDRKLSAIVAVGDSPDGVPQTWVVRSGAGSAWIPDLVVKVCTEHPEVVAVVVDDKKSTEPVANAVIDALADAELVVEMVRSSYPDMAEACAVTFDLIHEGVMRHAGDAELDAAVRSAVKDEREGAFTWSRRKAGAVVVPLVAMSLGVWEWRRRVAADYDVADSYL